MFAESLLFVLVIISIGVHALNAITGDFPIVHLWWLVSLGVGLDLYVFEGDKLLVALAMAIVLIVTAGLMPQRAAR